MPAHWCENQISLEVKYILVTRAKSMKACVSLVFDWSRWNYPRSYWSERTARDFLADR